MRLDRDSNDPSNTSFQINRLPDNTLEAGLEPLDGLGLGDLVGRANLSLAPSAGGDASTGAGPEERGVSRTAK